jgi:hypothetical protein
MGDYHGQMNATNFEKWGVKKLMVNLAPHLVIVLDNASYHCLQTDKPLSSSYAVNADMISWLYKNGGNCKKTEKN